MDMNALLFPLAQRFVAGTTSKEALAVVKSLNNEGMSATLDFLGEDITSIDEAGITVAAYHDIIDGIVHQQLDANVSVKLSALGLVIDPAVAQRHLIDIVEAASALPLPFVRIDMERASTVPQTLEIVEALHAKGYPIGPVLQAYLRRTPDDVERMIEKQIRVRICKGAYTEPSDLAHTDMATIRREFLRSAESLLSRGAYPGIATHDPGIIEAIRRHTRDHDISSDSFEFQMLYGVRPALQRELVQAGYSVRVYVPYGTHWTGYFKRRILERKENAFFALSALFTK